MYSAEFVLAKAQAAARELIAKRALTPRRPVLDTGAAEPDGIGGDRPGPAEEPEASSNVTQTTHRA